MRRAGFVLSAIFATAPAGIAQVPPTTPQSKPPIGLADPNALPGAARVVAVGANAAANPALDAHLKAWEAKNKATISLYTDCEFVKKDTLRQREVAYTGVIMCMKPNLARMRIDNKADKNDFVAYLADGQTVHEYEGKVKTVTQYRIPAGGKGGVGDNLLMEFMSGMMTADDVKQRFDIKLDKEEQHYVHLKIVPRFEKDKKEFDSMLLVLFGPKLADRKWDYLPAVARMSKNNGQEVETWTFKDPKINNDGIMKEAFVATPPTPDWTVKQAGGPTNGVPKR